MTIHMHTDRMEFLLRRSSERARKTVELLAARRVLQDPEWLIRDKRMTVDSRLERLSALTERLLSQKKLDLGKTAASLDALSPLSILGRGYGVVRDMAGHTLCRVEDARIGEDIRVRLHDGVLSGTVTGIEKG